MLRGPWAAQLLNVDGFAQKAHPGPIDLSTECVHQPAMTTPESVSKSFVFEATASDVANQPRLLKKSPASGSETLERL
jgi:hypothetical protein